VVNSLRALAGDDGRAWPASDGQLLARRLGDGERTAVFRAASERVRNVESLFANRHEVCFFYLRVGDDVARVELPRWAATPERVARLHATLVDQCRRCDGYPRALQEAHEQAVISMGDRELFDRMLEAEALRQGMRTPANSKQMSKRRRGL
jgi:NurA-like 5'-3' nuclease